MGGGLGMGPSTGEPVEATRVGTRGVLRGSNPGAIFRRASRFRRSFSSSLAFRYASRRAACAVNVLRRDDSRVRIWFSKENG